MAIYTIMLSIGQQKHCVAGAMDNLDTFHYFVGARVPM